MFYSINHRNFKYLVSDKNEKISRLYVFKAHEFYYLSATKIVAWTQKERILLKLLLPS